MRYTLDVKIGPIEVDEEQIRAFCEKWGVAELAVFGSALREDFREDSDIDFLVTWKPGVRHRFFELVRMKDELAEVVDRDIDLLQRHLVEHHHNKYRRASILNTARVLYAAA